MNMKKIIKRLISIQQECRDKMTDLDEVDENLEIVISELQDIFTSKSSGKG